MDNLILLPCAFGVSGIKGNKKVSCLVSNNGKNKIFALKCKKMSKKCDIFLIRGLFFLFFNIYHLVLGIFAFSSVYTQEESKTILKAKNSLNITTKQVFIFLVIVLSALFSYVLLGVLPIKVSFYISPKNADIFLKRLIIGFIKCAMIYLALLFLKIFASFNQYFRFNAAIKQKQDEMGAVNFLTYLISSIFLVTFVLSVLGLSSNLWYSFIINIAVTILVFMVNYELFREIQKSNATKWIIVPFYFLISEKASQNENKCVNIVLKELELSGAKNMETIENGMPFSEAYVNAKQKLENADKYEKSDLDFIFCEILKINRGQLRLTKSVSKSDYKEVIKAVERRCSGEPITKIFEHANFYGLDFKVTKDVLSPRMDTEILAQTVLKECKPKTKVLDIGTGSGAIAITLAKLSGAKVTAVDISDKALLVAKQNAKQNEVNVIFKKSDLFSGLSRLSKFDIIVSNPPYIPSKDIQGLDKEVKDYDPLLALDGGISGLDFYEKIIGEAPKFLTKNGKIFFEVGINQAKDVKKLLQNSFKDITIVKDLNKIDRVVFATLE